MKITVTPTALEGVVLIDTPFAEDARGFFLESWNERDFSAAGLSMHFVQDNHSRSPRGVIRGLHYQDMRAPMGKLVRCTLGAVFDVAVDLRAGSPTCGKWVSVELTAANKRQIYVPAGFAHGFQALSEMVEVQYKQTEFYRPETEGSVAWNDPDLAIAWPIPNPTLSARDAKAASFKEYLARPAFRVTES